jgi:hypothetical protein
MQKPSYTTSKRALWLSSAMAWIILLLLAIGAMLGSEQAVRLAEILAPYLLGLIAAMLGIHRAGGSFDLWASLRHAPAGSTGGQT